MAAREIAKLPIVPHDPKPVPLDERLQFMGRLVATVFRTAPKKETAGVQGTAGPNEDFP